jgi:hypothetical protein
MKFEKLKVTKQMLHDSRFQGYSVYGIKKGYCDLHDCCEICNPKVRFWCKVISKIEDLQTKIINKEVTD